MNRRSFWTTGPAAAFLASGEASFGADVSATVSNPVIETIAGRIRGFVHDRVAGFKGVPYAAPTEGGQDWLHHKSTCALATAPYPAISMLF